MLIPGEGGHWCRSLSLYEAGSPLSAGAENGIPREFVHRVVSEERNQPGVDGGPAASVGPGPSAGRPAVLFVVAVVLAGVVAVAARPLTATAASTRAAAHHHDGEGTCRTGARTGGAVTAVKVVPGVATSPNWSGYVAYPSFGEMSFNQVSAQWTEPAVTCPKKDAWTLFWVGFDGWPKTDGTVEQGGTSAQCVNGVPQYSAFYEMWPTMAVTDLFSVNAGDQISASVVYSTVRRQFLITVSDVTTGASQTETETCAAGLSCARTSAEWVAESPSHFGTKIVVPAGRLRHHGLHPGAGHQRPRATPGPSRMRTGSTRASSGSPVRPRRWPRCRRSRRSGTTSTFSDTWHRK